MGRNIVNNEKYEYKVFKRKLNSPYEWENDPITAFKGRPASQFEKKQYRIQKGVNGGTDSIFVICSNLPPVVDVKDKIIFLGKEWTVESVGYYFDEARFVNAGLFSEEYIASKCPKGLNLQ